MWVRLDHPRVASSCCSPARRARARRASISILAGLIRPTAGVVDLCGRRLTSLTESRARACVASTSASCSKSDRLVPALTALANVAEVLRLRVCAPRRPPGRARGARPRGPCRCASTIVRRALGRSAPAGRGGTRAREPGPALLIGNDGVRARRRETALDGRSSARSSRRYRSRNRHARTTGSSDSPTGIIRMEDGRSRRRHPQEPS